MPLDFITKQIKKDENVSFEFTGKVQNYAVGITGFLLSFGTDDSDEYRVEKLHISLTPEPVGDNSVEVTLSAGMTDGDGTFTPYCWAYVTVVAWIGESDDAIFLGNVKKIKSGLNSEPQMTNRKPLSVDGFMSGIMAQFADEDNHDVNQLSINTGAVKSKTQKNAVVSAGNTTFNGWGSSGQNFYSAGLLSKLIENPGYEIQIVNFSEGATNYGKINYPKLVKFTKPVSKVIGIISSFNVKYSGSTAQKVTTINAGNMQQSKNRAIFSRKDAIHLSDSGMQATVYMNTTMFRNGDWHDGDESTTNEVSFLMIGILK